MRRPWTLLAWLLLLVARPALAGELKVYFFDVGQGDASLIVGPTGKTVLLDAGPREASPRLRARLEQLLNGPIDLAILTHAHADHLGGMIDALSVRGARMFIDSGFEHPSPSYDQLIKYVQEHQIQMVNAAPGRAIDLGGGASLTLLAPGQPFINGTSSDANANSIVARLSFGKRSFLFTGDAEPATEAALLKRPGELRADVLKVAHHGARESSTPPFLDAVHPAIAVISAGAGNPHDTPNRAVIDRLLALKAQVLRTDVDGEVRILSDGHSLQIHVEGQSATPTMLAEVAAPSASPAPAAHHAHERTERTERTERGARAERGAVSVEHVGDAAPPVERTAAHPAHVDLAAAHGATGVGKYVASQRSDVFHSADCTWAKKIKPENLVEFRTRQEAIDSNRRPASCCNP